VLVSIKDVAKVAGVSHATVSRAPRGSSLISDETTGRIQETVLALGYLPGAAAQSLKTNRSQALGVIVSSIDDPYFSEILRGIEEIAQGNHYGLFLAASQRDAGRERTIVRSMRQHRMDGIIICSTDSVVNKASSFQSMASPS